MNLGQLPKRGSLEKTLGHFLPYITQFFVPLLLLEGFQAKDLAPLHQEAHASFPGLSLSHQCYEIQERLVPHCGCRPYTFQAEMVEEEVAEDAADANPLQTVHKLIHQPQPEQPWVGNKDIGGKRRVVGIEERSRNCGGI